MDVDDAAHLQTSAVTAGDVLMFVDCFPQSGINSVQSSIECLDQERCEIFGRTKHVTTAV